MPDDRTTNYEPFFLLDEVAGSFQLVLSDRDMLGVMEVFENGGRYGNGYAWADVALAAMRAHAQDLEEHIEMDPEAGTFVAMSQDRQAIERLGALLRDAFHDHTKLAELVRSAPFEFD